MSYSSDSDSIKVFVRVRPLTQGTGLTTDGDQSLCLTVTSPNTIRLLSKPEPRTFTYDHVADMDTSQVGSREWLSAMCIIFPFSDQRGESKYVQRWILGVYRMTGRWLWPCCWYSQYLKQHYVTILA